MWSRTPSVTDPAESAAEPALPATLSRADAADPATAEPAEETRSPAALAVEATA
jgi:hypothetical protein